MASQKRPTDVDLGSDCNSSSKKAKVRIDPFTVKGECDDEVTFRFDDGNELYASKGFLMYMSPVFKRMFQTNFKEKKTGIVQMPGKKLEAVLQFLMASYPGEKHKITEKNVLQLIPLVEEYQVDVLRIRCGKVLQREIKNFKTPVPLGRVSRILDILKLLLVYACEELKTRVLAILETCNGKYLLGADACMGINNTSEEVNNTLNTCRDLFRSLPTHLQNQILETRICKVERNPPCSL